ncbi:MAG: trehalose-phosphatase [Gemmatimonadaceae bacterium]
MTASSHRGAGRLTDAVGNRLDGAPLVVLLDLDGTLAPIAATPEGAQVPAETKEVLRRLIATPGLFLAVVSGRSAQDAASLAGVDGLWVVGNHGFESREPRGDIVPDDRVLPFERAVADVARDLAVLESSVPGSLVENKRWTLSVHYRLVDPAAVPSLKERVRESGERAGLRASEGKQVMELRPAVEISKGTASVALAERLGGLTGAGNVIYAGDDRTDEDAFRALRARSRSAVTVRIVADEAPEFRVPTEAEFALSSPAELRVALEWLAARRSAREALKRVSSRPDARGPPS